MDRYKLKFTKLQQAVLNGLFARPEMAFTGRALANALSVSPTAIAKSLKGLEKEGLVKVEKDRDSGRLAIKLNRDNPWVFHLKRAENLKAVYESGLADYLGDSFPGAAIVLFGSYSFGEDTSTSDVDMAVIGSKEKALELERFSKLLQREIRLNFYESLAAITKNLKESIINGIVLKGAMRL
ncbi:nucleotidyltransferase domain-containing protein [Candidatus Woesearchaeota archaeon]|nr:nucleotidyltransferase domain-containing protein [Candidatus Woesearchaeota archaeon]